MAKHLNDKVGSMEYDITQADRDALRERGIYLGQVLD